MSDIRYSRRSFLKTAVAAGAASVLVRRAPSWAETSAPVAPGKVRFGVQTAPQLVAYKDMADVWREADELFAFDHLMPIFSDPNGPCFEGWTLLSSLAGKTSRAKVGLLVTGNTYRNPALVAKMAATVDHATEGRLILGMGAGWFEREHEAYGFPFYTPGKRARRLVEAVEVIKLLFTQGESSLDGKYYTLRSAPFAPKPVQKPHPPILIGGMGPKVVQPLAARSADVWHFFVREGGAEQAKKLVTRFDEICRKEGRDPADVEKATSLGGEALALPSKEIRERVRALSEAGVGLLILSLRAPYDRAALRRFAKEVMPAFRPA
jgi:alkanesulfonate monooxygenase SsuD/methylene tetrahydromethanopterin reductase-like flavin-dependent oxidoreductase (luciferase family)